MSPAMSDMHADRQNTAPRIEIALATYNGARYLAPFLDSLVRQTHGNFGLVVSDDGSTDDTVAIVENYADRLAIRIIRNPARGGVARNFETALATCTSDYVALADQDDFWLPEKLERSLAILQAQESRLGAHVPALAFCDLRIVDERLNVLHESFFQSTLKSRNAHRLEDFILDNHVPGCACMVNRAALDRALPFPDIAIHDWWLILIAAAAGGVCHVPEALILYRQHASNSIGIGAAGQGIGAHIRKIASAPAAFLASRIEKAEGQVRDARRNLAALEQRLGETPVEVKSRASLQRLAQSGWRNVLAELSGADTGVRQLDKYLMLWLLARRNAARN